MKKISLTQGFEALVDDEDYERLSAFKWNVHMGGKNNFYAARRVNKKNLLMHHVIYPISKPFCVDHIDGNGCNNQKNNLRVCLHKNNLCNAAISKNNTSGFKGVYWQKGKWVAAISPNGKCIYLGRFSDPKEAAKVYDTAAEFHYGEFARF